MSVAEPETSGALADWKTAPPVRPDQEDAPESVTPAELLSRIVADPDVCFGKPRVAGTRMYVAAALEYFAGGDSEDDILGYHPGLTRSDLRACLLYAAEMTRVKMPPPVAAGQGPVRPDIQIDDGPSPVSPDTEARPPLAVSRRP